MFLDDLEVQKCAHPQGKSFPIYIKTTKNSHSFFIEMKIVFFFVFFFCMIYLNIP